MEITYQDLGHLLEKPPGISDLIWAELDRRRGQRGEILVIIPAYHDRERLKTALAALSTQNFRNFDIVVVYGKDDSYLQNRKLSILHIKRKVDYSGVGAVYLGQAIAFRDRYKYFMAVTVDRIPFAPDSLKKLYETAEAEGLEYLIGDWKLVSHQPTSQCLGGLVRTSILTKAGLYPLPLEACDDVEFHYRLMKASRKTKYLDAPTNRIFANFGSPTEAKLARLLRNGGRDTTYMYPKMIGSHAMPEIFLDLSIYPFAEKSFFLRRATAAVKFLFIANLCQRLYELRVPALAEYRLRARKNAYAYPVWKDCSGDCTLSAARKSRISHKEYPAKIRSGLSAAASGFLKSDSRNLETGVYVVLYDSCRIWDPVGPTECALKWTRKASLARKIACAILASTDTLDNVLRAAMNFARKRHFFDGYGASALSDPEKGAMRAQRPRK